MRHCMQSYPLLCRNFKTKPKTAVVLFFQKNDIPTAVFFFVFENSIY